MRVVHLVCLFLFCLSSCGNPYAPPSEIVSSIPMPPLAESPKNVILMIGDGMGISQITAGMYSNDNFLHLENFPIVGLHKCYASDNLITDSAASATSFSSGVKTFNGAIGVDADTIPVTTIVERAEKAGMQTGLIATSSIVHATPAAFYAHVKSRKAFEDIALQFLDSDVDLVIGGGSRYFNQRSDERNLYSDLRQNGYVVADFNTKALSEIPINFDKKLAYFTALSEPLSFSQGRDYLLPAVSIAPIFLSKRSQDNGFFLMVESSQIEWGGQTNQSDYIISEMLEFNSAIGKVLEFAKEDGQTLVVVTADHETGGYAINRGSKMDSLVTAFTTTKHTGTMIPVFAYGPGAELFAGIYENTAIHNKIKYALGLETDQVKR
ncbi:MAG: alkaline phosphatase [Bacteroidota bacterium]